MSKNNNVQTKTIYIWREKTWAAYFFGVHCCLCTTSTKNVDLFLKCPTLTSFIGIIKTNVSLSPHLICQSDINTIGPRKVGHVGCQGRVGGQNFNGQVPTECIHVDMFCAGPHGDLWLVLKHRRRFQRLSGSDEFKVQTPLQVHCTESEFSVMQMMTDSQRDAFKPSGDWPMSVLKPGVTLRGMGSEKWLEAVWRHDSRCRPWPVTLTACTGRRWYFCWISSSLWRLTEYCKSNRHCLCLKMWHKDWAQQYVKTGTAPAGRECLPLKS